MPATGASVLILDIGLPCPLEFRRGLVVSAFGEAARLDKGLLFS